MRLIKMTILLPVLLWLSACSIQGKNQPGSVDIYRQYVEQNHLDAVSKVKAFRMAGWQALDDQWLLLDNAPSQPYLLHVSIPCTELRWANLIQVRQTMPRVLQADFDSIHVPRSPEIRCTIDEIYPLTAAQKDAIVKLSHKTTAH